MNDAERIRTLQGRVNAQEALIMMFSGIVLAQAPNDPGRQKAIAILDQVRSVATARSEEDPNDGCVPETKAALDALLSEISENLNLLNRRG
jgi:hypothetical protein